MRRSSFRSGAVYSILPAEPAQGSRAMPLGQQTDQTASQAWKGQWCWTRKHVSRPWNSYAYFRRSIELPARPRSAVIRISADARYTIFVNGKRIHLGPARSFPQFQSYGAVELADFLDAGPNAICAIVHQFGVPTFQSIYRD